MQRMKLLRQRFQKWLAPCAACFAGLLFAGCSHLYYADPNPSTPYVFPGQGSPAPAAGSAQFAPVGPPQASLNPIATPDASVSASVPRSTASDILAIGDSIMVSFSDIPAPGILPVTQRIGSDGMITLPFNVKIRAAGRTTGQLQDDIRKAYVPNIYVNMAPAVASEERVFFVEGEVKLPSRQQYKGEMTVLRAITSAGGFTDFAQRKKIQLRRANGEKHIINWYKASLDGNLDLKVFPNDMITVLRRVW